MTTLTNLKKVLKIANLDLTIDRHRAFNVTEFKLYKKQDWLDRLFNKPRQLFATFNLSQFINCSGICILTSFNIVDKNKGYGTELLKTIQAFVKKNNYSVLMCTTLANNTAMVSVLNKNEFEVSNKFKNIKTGNIILTFQKNL